MTQVRWPNLILKEQQSDEGSHQEGEAKEMKNSGAISAAGLSMLLAAGCATSFTAKGREADSVTTQGASLESQIGTLNQRIEELTQRQETLETQMAARPSKQSEAVARAKAPALSTRQVQVALKAGGFYNGSVDGKPGPQTKEAVKAFQRSNGLHPDGVVGSRTATQLAKLLASNTAPAGTPESSKE